MTPIPPATDTSETVITEPLQPTPTSETEEMIGEGDVLAPNAEEIRAMERGRQETMPVEAAGPAPEYVEEVREMNRRPKAPPAADLANEAAEAFAAMRSNGQ